jgi:hypothetical protein
MKKGAIILLIVASMVWPVIDAIRNFREAVTFYSSQPKQLLFVLAIVSSSGLVGIVFYCLSPSGQRRAKLCALGGLAAFLATLLGYWLFQLVPMMLLTPPAPTEVLMVSLAFMFFGALAGGVWYEFFHVRKTGRTRFL